MVSPRLIAKIESEEPAARLAVLIDADNAQAAVIEGLLAEIARFGEAIVSGSTATSHRPAAHHGKRYCKGTQLSPCSSMHTQQERMPRIAH